MTARYGEQDVRERAYSLWVARGRPKGDPEADWLSAEAQLATEAGSVTEVPGSLARGAPPNDAQGSTARNVSPRPARKQRPKSGGPA